MAKRKSKAKAGRPREKQAGRSKSRKTKNFSVMKIRHWLYKYWRGRYKSFAETKQDANDIINDLIARGYRKVTFKSVREWVKEQNQYRKQQSKQAIPDWHDLIPSTVQLNTPIPFYHAQGFCSAWSGVHKSVFCFSKDIWEGRRYYGGEPINYGEAFGLWARRMYKLQKKKTGDYNFDWHFIALTPEYNEKEKCFEIRVISGSSDGHHIKYKDDGTTEPGDDVQVPLPKGRIEPAPEPPKPPEEKPATPAASSDLTKEDKIELEKEKIKAEAEAKAKVETDVKKAKLDQFTKLFSDGKITFEQYERLVSTL